MIWLPGCFFSFCLCSLKIEYNVLYNLCLAVYRSFHYHTLDKLLLNFFKVLKVEKVILKTAFKAYVGCCFCLVNGRNIILPQDILFTALDYQVSNCSYFQSRSPFRSELSGIYKESCLNEIRVIR